MTPLRAGVIGVGHLCQHHARLYASLPGSRLVAVNDQSLERAHTIADRHGKRMPLSRLCFGSEQRGGMFLKVARKGLAAQVATLSVTRRC